MTSASPNPSALQALLASQNASSSGNNAQAQLLQAMNQLKTPEPTEKKPEKEPEESTVSFYPEMDIQNFYII